MSLTPPKFSAAVLVLLMTVPVLTAPLLAADSTAARETRSDQLRPLVLQADFAGLVMTGVAYSVEPRLRVHNVRPLIPLYDIAAASASLAYNAQSWPEGSVFVSVVDPGVGTARKSVVLKTLNGLYFVSPDNGSLSGPAAQYGIAAVREIDETVNRIPGSDWSHTFHGRDVYSYTGAKLAAGVIDFEGVGPLLAPEVMQLPRPQATRDGEVLHGVVAGGIGRLGNAYFNIERDLFESLQPVYGEPFAVRISHNEQLVWEGTLPYVRAFGAVPVGEPLLFMNSSGNLAVAINQGNFAAVHGIQAGADWQVSVSRAEPAVTPAAADATGDAGAKPESVSAPVVPAVPLQGPAADTPEPSPQPAPEPEPEPEQAPEAMNAGADAAPIAIVPDDADAQLPLAASAVSPARADAIAVPVSRQHWIASRDTYIPATLVAPRDPQGPLPLVLLLHGHGGTRHEAGGFTQLADTLARRGIASIRMDFPGCGESIEPFRNNNLTNMLADARSAHAFALTQLNIDPERQALLGFSMGGRLAIHLSPELSGLKAIALWAPSATDGADHLMSYVGGPQSWQAMRAQANAQGYAPFTTFWGQRQQLGARWFTDLEASRPVPLIEQFEQALLVVYGDEDPVIPPADARAVIEQATRARATALHEVRGADHGFGLFNNRPDLTAETVQVTANFLAAQLNGADFNREPAIAADAALLNQEPKP